MIYSFLYVPVCPTTCSLVSFSARCIFSILLQHHISKLSKYFRSSFLSVQMLQTLFPMRKQSTYFYFKRTKSIKTQSVYITKQFSTNKTSHGTARNRIWDLTDSKQRHHWAKWPDSFRISLVTTLFISQFNWWNLNFHLLYGTIALW